MNYKNLLGLKEFYERGGNITEYLKKKFNETRNTTEIIEIAYDLQAGSYIEYFRNNRDKLKLYENESAKILYDHVLPEDSLLDVGTGELTALIPLLNSMSIIPKNVLAFDISLSRIIKGKKFTQENLEKKNLNLSFFVADMLQIPLHTNCIDVVTSNHSLEPNGKNLEPILKELFRVTKKKLVLFEPSYEHNSIEGKKRMDKFGYIKDIQLTVEKLGGTIIDIAPLKHSTSHLNQTACFIIKPPETANKLNKNMPTFCVPGTNYILKYKNGFQVSKDTGLVFPVFQNIPILRKNYGILASAEF